jgi:hypothetical protein
MQPPDAQAEVVGEFETVGCITYPPMYSSKSPGTLSMRAMMTKIEFAARTDDSRSTGDEGIRLKQTDGVRS